MRRLDQAGFTIPELLVVGGVLLVFIVLAAVFMHPRDYSPDERNSQRRIDIAALLQATRAYKEDKGHLPPSIAADNRLIGSAAGASNLCADLVPDYIRGMPRDPLNSDAAPITDCNKKGANYSTEFTVLRTSDGQHVLFSALLAENNQKITVSF